MVAPGAVVGDAHASLALAIGRHQRAVHVDLGPLEERGGLAGPGLPTRVVEDLLQGGDVGGAEAAAEVARSGRVGETAGAESVEEVGVGAAEFEVLQAGAVAQGVVGQSEDMVGFVVGQVKLQQAQAVVDAVDEAELAGEDVEGTDAAVGDAADAVGDFVMDVAGGEHRSGATAEIGLVQAALDPARAAVLLLVYPWVHLKTLVTGVFGKRLTLQTPQECRGFSTFSAISHRQGPRDSLIQGLARRGGSPPPCAPGAPCRR
jgi:hypothetical protein